MKALQSLENVQADRGTIAAFDFSRDLTRLVNRQIRQKQASLLLAQGELQERLSQHHPSPFFSRIMDMFQNVAILETPSIRKRRKEVAYHEKMLQDLFFARSLLINKRRIARSMCRKGMISKAFIPLDEANTFVLKVLFGWEK